MLTIDALAYRSKLVNLSPKAKAVFAILPLFLCIGLSSIGVSIATILVMGFVTIKMGGTPLRKYLQLMAVPVGFLIMGTITILFGQVDSQGQVLISFSFHNHIYGITSGSFLYGISIFTKALGAVSCMYFTALSTPMTDIMHLLRWLHLPGLLVSLMELIYRYIFVLLEEAQRMKTAQNARLGYVNIKTSIRSMGEMTAALFLRAYIRCDKIYAALQSRGYEGELKRLEQEYTPSAQLYVACLAFSALLVTLAFVERGIV